MSFSEWKKYKLGDFADVQNGYAFKADDFSDSGIPVIKIKNIVSPNINVEGAQCFDGEITSRLKQFIVEKDDILISMTGSHINQIASAVAKVGKYQFEEPALLNQRVGKVFVFDKSIGDEKYLFYYLNRYDTQYELASSAGGSANQANISPTQIKNLELELPPLGVQQQISSILSSLDDKIELNRQMAQTLEAMAQALFKEMCLPKGDELPDGWKVGKFGEVATQVKEIISPTKSPQDLFDHYSLPAYDDGEVPVKDIGRTILSNKTAVKKYSVLFSKLNPRIPRIWSIGNIDESVSICSTEFIGFVPKKEYLYSFINCFLKQSEVTSKLTGHATGTSSSHQRIKPDGILSLVLIIPSKECLMNFDKAIRPLLETKFNNIQENQTLSSLRDSLLPKLMKGEINKL